MQHGRAEQRLREARDAAGAGRPRREPLAEAARSVERTRDDRVPLGVERQHAALPLGRRRGAWTVATSRRAVAATRGSTSTASLGVSLSPSSPNHARCSATRSSAKPYRAGGIGARTAISSRRSRRAPPDRERAANPVPDDRVAALVEPVVRRGDVRRPTLPRRRSRPRRAPSSALRRAADRATTSASVRREARARH